ncbi:MAG: TetR/AcrR family transcriptional regulator [Oceanococcus sp.]|nr:MAG: TetR/AcrR family transcriptional regulator [Oceanococcus sp.]
MSTAANSKAPSGNAANGRRRGADSLRAAKDALVRQHVMDASEKVFAEHGFNQTKMQTIAKQAGVSLATLYQFYSSKQALYRAVLVARDREMMSAVLQHPVFQSGQPFTAISLLSLMQGHLRFQLSHPDYLKLILQEGHAWYHTAAQPTADEQALWEQGLKLMTTALEHGMQAGELIPADPTDQARLLMAIQQARLASWAADGMQDDHETVITRIQADFVRQFCRPALARTLLSEDGSTLCPQALQKIQAG